MTLQTLDMRFIRYLNLFEKITKVSTKNCFFYNNSLVFAVSRNLVSRAIGENGNNVKRMVSILGKKIKIVAFPERTEEIRDFIADIVEPVTFKDVAITPEEIIISGSMQTRAALIGRNKKRYLELKKIIKELFNKELKIA